MKLSPLFTWRSAIVASKLTPTQKLVALALSLYMNERGGSAFPKVPTLCSETSLGETAVREALRALCEGGWLNVVKRRSGQPTEYEATIPCTPADGVHNSDCAHHEARLCTPPADGPLSRRRQGRRTPSGSNDPSGGEDAARSSKRTDEERGRFDELWQAIEGEGMRAPTLPRSARTGWVALVWEALDAHVAPADIARWARAYREHPTLGRAMLTLPALLKWAAQLDGDDKAVGLRQRLAAEGVVLT